VTKITSYIFKIAVILLSLGSGDAFGQRRPVGQFKVSGWGVPKFFLSSRLRRTLAQAHHRVLNDFTSDSMFFRRDT
jgi:hypothetical protein